MTMITRSMTATKLQMEKTAAKMQRFAEQRFAEELLFTFILFIYSYAVIYTVIQLLIQLYSY
jgi:hypothetical protein